ncbi:5-dehydro-2-deoxygluconokinase [Fluoribacter gormanii]|uniref:5-dehydro-2-deoxygluconokinase n=1 Tax=Fluoribacter gormanii TaxID=464 RepID=A0A377GMT3_9GAMM|nr:5-dehydro-2-deoxygluconokinase [Fluoribacter gormanii]KTD04464.1 IolC/IolB transferase kinase protein [Fluoribacter gormanii]SIR89294.1 5-deoxyglucuronate isomerase /5-dehydro-2-deoxygluconokinase [Fluoribacter gormanii]STO26147.1 5-dehydro-2-deoxygluconokinase [Fluoribacter gormanii]
MIHQSFYFDATRPVDLICMGRVAVDLYAEQIGLALSDVQSFKKYLGGCAGNIAVGAARLGLNCMMFSCIGQDEMGRFLKSELETEGVNTDLLQETAHHLTGLVLLGIKPPHEFPLMFYRTDCADMQIKSHQINQDVLQQAKAILITGTGLSTAAMRQTTEEVAQLARHAETAVVLDLDYRPVLWGLTALGDGETRYLQSQKVSKTYQRILPFCDLIVGTEEEICIAGGCDDVDSALKKIRELTQAPVVIKQGEKGCEVNFARSRQNLPTKPFPVQVLNVLGAGDGFMAGLLSALLRGQSWEVATTYANASGALVVTRHGCAPAIPYKEELEYFIHHFDEHPQIWNSAHLTRLHQKKAHPQLLIKNPQGFTSGFNSIVTINPLSNDSMNFSSIKLNAGQKYLFNEHYEFAALLMTGSVEFHFAHQRQHVARYDYFSQEPIVLHCSSGQTAAVEALTDCEILLIETENDASFDPLLFNQSNLLELDNRGKDILDDTSYRIVRTVFDKRNRPESNLVVGEIITFQGRWSSYPSHYHDQPEIYHYRFSEPQGYAFGENGNEVLRIENYDTYRIANGQTHAHCAAPGYALYTLWFIRHLKDNPYTTPTFIKEHEWTRTHKANNRVWKNNNLIG